MEIARFPSRGGFSVRSIFTLALTAILAALFTLLFSSTPAGAVTATSATWSGDDIILFDDHGFTKATDFSDPTGTVPDGATVYKAPLQPSDTSTTQKLLVLYLAPGVDPPTATSAQYVEFDSNDGTLSNPTESTSITLAEQGTSDGYSSSCSVSGIGWIICPVSVFLAESMDNLFNLIDDFVKTQPLTLGNTDNPMYTAWSISRSIANVAFVIAFLIIIFSQLTSIGISNYGLKKLVPRLVVAAVLVNVSYYISAIAIDLSNIIGYSIQDIFVAIRQDVFHMTNDNFAGVNNNPWSAVTSVVLGAGGFFGGIYYVSTAGPYILVTLLVGLGLVALFVLLILAARQAIIIILVIISPLAFVANLLPNTEKWFEKWKDLFMTMLIFFPAFALVFAGSQLAGQLIIQNAGDNIVTVIFGLAVQVAPLVVTPYLLKFSGGLLGRIAQMANDPRKGIMDRTKGWQKEKSEIQRQRVMSSKRPIAKPFQILENNRRARKSLTETYQKNADSRWEESNRYKKLAERSADADENKARVHKEHEAHINQLKAGQGHKYAKKVDLYQRTIETENATVTAELADSRVTAIKSEYRSGQFDTNGHERLEKLQKNMAENVMRTTAYKRAAEGASMIQQFEYAKEINSSQPTVLENAVNLQTVAAGIDPNGAQRAQASATAVIQEIRNKTIKNMSDIILDKNPTNEEIRLLAQGISVRGIAATQDAVAAALQLTFSRPDTGEIARALENVDLSFTSPQYASFTEDQREELRVLTSQALGSNASKPPYITAGILGRLAQGTRFDDTPFTGALGASGVDSMIASVIEAGKVDSGKLQSAGKDYAEVLLRAVRNAPEGAISAERLAELYTQLDITLDTSREAYEKLGDSKDALKGLRSLIEPFAPSDDETPKNP